MIRPLGLAAGGVGLVLAWIGGVAIAQLTGATPVVIVLVAGVVLFVAAAVSGYVALRGVRVESIVLPRLSTQGAAVACRIDVDAHRAVWIDVIDPRRPGSPVASGWAGRTGLATTAEFAVRGPVELLRVHIRSAGGVGIVWWRRAVDVAIEEHLVAPRPVHGGADIERSMLRSAGDRAGRAGAVAGEIDGIRPWRDGDSERFVHWSSTLRSGALVVHDRRAEADEQWLVRARLDTAEPDVEAGRVLSALEQGLRSNADVAVALGDGAPHSIADIERAMDWTARADLGATDVAASRRRPFSTPVEPETTAPTTARWWSAGATLVALTMLTGALGYSTTVTVLVALAVVAGAAVSSRSLATGEPAAAWVRAAVGVGALLALAMVIAASGHLDGLLSVLRGPLPQVLVILIALHGFECRDRRTIRVGLGISAVVLMYASGFRVDGTLGWWLLAWAICFGVSLRQLVGPTTRTSTMRRSASASGGAATWLVVGALATMAMLAIVPVPDGPARLTLPTFFGDAPPVGQPGAIAAPDGEIRDDDQGEVDRSPAGQAGGYTGFAQTMDTSVRGALSDEIVMRVRAPEPDFWRGQTFARFDGRRWHADDDQGVLREGPNIDVPPTLGDNTLPSDVPVDRFVQTYHVETDMPNVVFAAYRPDQIIIDADVWTRPDGAIRSSVVHTEGSVYTVVSARPVVTDDALRRQGLIGPRLSVFGREVLAPYLDVPASTTERTVALADELADGLVSTFDVVRSYEAWMNANVVYDLNSPLPAPGADAVDDFLFESQRGFCEQIASALTIMLRTQGVPARLVTGYVAGSRDRIAGVFEVRGSDAHAWVEVWFPETGWQAFDPTASVPLSGDAQIGSIGADLAAGVGGYIEDDPLMFGLVIAAAIGVFLSVRVITELRRRRRRGRWGLLQDRFTELADQRGSPAGAANPSRADSWEDDDRARVVADRLDRAAFDPGFDDDDRLYDDTRKLVGSLRGGGR